MEISSTTSKLEAEEALNIGLQRKNKDMQVRPPSVNRRQYSVKDFVDVCDGARFMVDHFLD